MKVLCYGSLNIDKTFSVDHIVKEGETLSSFSMRLGAGGKGANQAAALAKAGADVYLAGKCGTNGKFMLDTLSKYGVNTEFVTMSDNPSGEAIIQLDRNAQNSIVLFPGENHNIKTDEIDHVLNNFEREDTLLIQNEINNIGYLIDKAYEKGMSICFNVAPFDSSVFNLPLGKVSMFIVNEIEGESLAGYKKGDSFEDVIRQLLNEYPKAEIVLTVGKEGSYYAKGNVVIKQGIIDYPVVDTTAAGDTFIGYLLSSRIRGYGIERSLFIASKASGIAVSRTGAMESIPCASEVFK